MKIAENRNNIIAAKYLVFVRNDIVSIVFIYSLYWEIVYILGSIFSDACRFISIHRYIKNIYLSVQPDVSSGCIECKENIRCNEGYILSPLLLH